jgi:uroporphyrinogen-III synthase
MARREVVYETLATPPDAATASAIPTLSAVLLHSPKAAGALAAHLAVHPAPALLAVCLSPAVAAPLDPLTLRTITVAADPAETALLDALVAALRTTAQ